MLLGRLRSVMRYVNVFNTVYYQIPPPADQITEEDFMLEIIDRPWRELSLI